MKNWLLQIKPIVTELIFETEYLTHKVHNIWGVCKACLATQIIIVTKFKNFTSFDTLCAKYLIIHSYSPVQKHVFILLSEETCLYYPIGRILIALTPTQKYSLVPFTFFQFSKQNLVGERAALKVDEKKTYFIIVSDASNKLEKNATWGHCFSEIITNSNSPLIIIDRLICPTDNSECQFNKCIVGSFKHEF